MIGSSSISTNNNSNIVKTDFHVRQPMTTTMIMSSLVGTSSSDTSDDHSIDEMLIEKAVASRRSNRRRSNTEADTKTASYNSNDFCHANAKMNSYENQNAISQWLHFLQGPML